MRLPRSIRNWMSVGIISEKEFAILIDGSSRVQLQFYMSSVSQVLTETDEDGTIDEIQEGGTVVMPLKEFAMYRKTPHSFTATLAPTFTVVWVQHHGSISPFDVHSMKGD